MFVATCIAVSVPAWANLGPVASSLGGAGVAAMSPVEASYYNPASISNAEHNHALLGFTQKEIDGVDFENFNVQAVDAGRDTMIKGAFSYHRQEITSVSSRKTVSKWELSGAKYASPGATYGISLTKQITQDHKLEKEWVDYNMDWGAVHNLSPSWGVGYLIEDMFSGKEDRQLRKTTIGAEYRLAGKFRYLLDLSFQDQMNPDRNWIAAMGIELRVSDSFDWRFGYRSDDLEGSNYYTAGFSWQGPRLGIYYAFQNNTAKSAESIHILDLRVFF